VPSSIPLSISHSSSDHPASSRICFPRSITNLQLSCTLTNNLLSFMQAIRIPARLDSRRRGCLLLHSGGVQGVERDVDGRHLRTLLHLTLLLLAHLQRYYTLHSTSFCKFRGGWTPFLIFDTPFQVACECHNFNRLTVCRFVLADRHYKPRRNESIPTCPILRRRLIHCRRSNGSWGIVG
jgi:hypothetical protein